MYSQKLAIAVKHNGRVLREQGEAVFLPFGSEYSIYVKNMNSLRAKVRVSVDGVDVLGGDSLIVNANSAVDLERFLDTGNERGHRFKFIERTAKIEDGPRGIKVDDGLIRVEFAFERQAPKIEYIDTIRRNTYVDEYRYYPPHRPYWVSSELIGSAGYSSNQSPRTKSSGTSRASLGDVKLKGASSSVSNSIADAVNMYDPSAENFTFPQSASGGSKVETLSDVGITVRGSESNQRFVTVSDFPTDGQTHVMVLHLRGVSGETVIKEPVTVKTKSVCPTCGTTNPFNTKFCNECGTSLTVL